MLRSEGGGGKKKKSNFLIYKVIQRGSVAKVIYEEGLTIMNAQIFNRI
jgi:hypothetical protein